jgi:hypothetical protein
MKLNTDLSIQGIITAPIPNREKQAILQAIKEGLANTLDNLNELMPDQDSIEKLDLRVQIDMIDRIIAKYVIYEC